MTIEQTLRSLGVKWLRTVSSYSVAKMAETLKEAMRTAERGLKVIIADGECQLVRQRRVRAEDAEKLKRGERVVRMRFGVDDEICTGDHSCIRLSGCPSLTVKPNPDPLRSDPVATVIESCVGCGLCGEVAHAAVLCPSFYRAEIIRNPSWWDRALYRVRRTVIGWFAPAQRARLVHDRTGRPADHHPDRRARRRRRRRADGLDRQRGVAARLSRAVDLDPRRRPAHRRHHLLHRDRSGCRGTSSAPGRPVLALAPGIGDVDIVLASELMEAGRTIAAGFVTPDRTLMIASTTRSYLVVEKMAMGDGRYDSARLIKAVEDHAQAHLLIDMETLARQSGAMINAVMLGIIAGCGRLPIPAAAFESAIRADGKAVETNLRGFRAGLDAAQQAKRRAPRVAPASATRADAPRSPISSARSSRPCRRRPATSSPKARGD